MSDTLTRPGARELTAAIDRIASVVQTNPAMLGLPPKIAMDFARRCDMISDQVEKTAVSNFPVTAAEGVSDPDPDPDSDDQNKPEHFEDGSKKATSEDGSIGALNGGWEPGQIADQESGPFEGDADEPYMATFDEEEYHQLGDKVESGAIHQVDKFAGFSLTRKS